MRPEGFEFRKCSPFVNQSWKELRLIFTPSTCTAKSYIPASVYAERINTGYGLERAILGIAIWNTEETAKNVTWLEEWPAWIKVYMHSMRVTVNDEQVSNGENFVLVECTSQEPHGLNQPTIIDGIVQKMLHRQAHTRGRPTLIEASVFLPPKSVVRIMVDIDRAYLRYTDYPPDAMRGFDVPSGIVLTKLVEGGSKRIYTTSTLLDMPTPDFSMPYNVIILTCKSVCCFLTPGRAFLHCMDRAQLRSFPPYRYCDCTLLRKYLQHDDTDMDASRHAREATKSRRI